MAIDMSGKKKKKNIFAKDRKLEKFKEQEQSELRSEHDIYMDEKLKKKIQSYKRKKRK